MHLMVYHPLKLCKLRCFMSHHVCFLNLSEDLSGIPVSCCDASIQICFIYYLYGMARMILLFIHDLSVF